MTVRQLCVTMDASELMEWAAYFKLQDKDNLAMYEAQIRDEQNNETKNNALRAFLSLVRPPPPTPIKVK